MRLTSQTYRVLREFLTSEAPTTQVDLAARSAVSLSQVNRTIHQLMATGYARRGSDGRYEPQAAPALLAHLAFQRPFNQLAANVVMVRADPQEVKDALVREGCVLCLDSALEAYSSYFRSDRVCAYTTDAPRIMDGLRPAMGGLLKVQLYEPDIPLDEDVEDGHTKRFRTLLDMVCDGKTYAAKDLFQQLWRIEIG